MTVSRMTSLIGTGFRVERRASERAVGEVALEWAGGFMPACELSKVQVTWSDLQRVRWR